MAAAVQRTTNAAHFGESVRTLQGDREAGFKQWNEWNDPASQQVLSLATSLTDTQLI